jgi:hypothetical protein
MDGGVSGSDNDHDSASDSDSEIAAAQLQARRTAAVSGAAEAVAGEWAGLPLARADPINGRTFDFSSLKSS